MYKRFLVAAAINLALAASAFGLTIGTGGTVTDWGITPFSQANQYSTGSGNLWTTVQNNYAPINYPDGVGRVPSPGLSAGGETFDLEEMYIRTAGSQMQVLVVGSNALTTNWGGSQFYVGDLFITTGGDRYGIVTQSAGRSLTAGSVYLADGAGDVLALQNIAYSYYGYSALVQNDYGPPGTVADVAGPWGVTGTSQLIGSATVNSTIYNYGGTEGNTFLVEYTFDKSLLGIGSAFDLTTRITWGCGNDLIQDHAERVNGSPPPVPEPKMAAMAMVGTGMIWFAARRRVREFLRHSAAG
jgi:hypothetical protein